MKLPVVSGKTVVKFLNRKGFEIVGRKGSHIRMNKKTPAETLVTVVPLHKKLDAGTLLGILKQCGVSKEEFMKEFRQ